MEPAAIVTIIAAVLIIAALVVYLVAVIGELRKINAGLEAVIGSVGEVVRKSQPVGEIVEAINADLTAGTDLLEGLLEKKAGPDDGPGLIESVFPGGGKAMLERQGRAGEVKNIDIVYTRGAIQLARLGRESPLGAGPLRGEALRDAIHSSAAARSLYTRPGGDPTARPASPAIGVDAPRVYPAAEAPTSGDGAGSGAKEAGHSATG
ncbi:MAG TPA: hypothetical protein VK919_06885 [Solirubrobacterales bacterium]|nr:hypothetical protein [Solirubrobacterales bacterium]